MKGLHVTRGFLAFICVLLIMVFSTAGCMYVVVGGVGALGGYVVSPDTVEGTIIDYSYNEVWDTSTRVFSQLGLIEEHNDTAGILLGRIGQTKITVTVLYATKSSVKLSVKARRAMFPKIKIAQDVYAKIVAALTSP